MSDADTDADAENATGGDDAAGFPAFAAQRAKRRSYSVEGGTRSDHEGRHIRIRDLQGTPAQSMTLTLIHDANTEGWQLLDYHESGDELLFVPFDAEIDR